MMPATYSHSMRGSRFRHVVFSGMGRGRVIDFAPASAQRTAYQPTSKSPFSADQRAFVNWLFERAGLDASIYRSETLHRRLPACMRALRASSPAHARQIVQQTPSLLRTAISAMIIGVTSFFRDAGVFDQLTFTVLPAISRCETPVRIWSAGCSDGAELYSVAMLLAEMQLLDDAYLLGTDCRVDAISRARAGAFDANELKAIPQTWIDKYFVRQGEQFQIGPRLRNAAQFRTADVTQLLEPGAWDVILCRNLGMYFRPQVAGKLWETFEHAIRPGGFLVLGKAERPMGSARLACVAPCIYRRDLG
jgi:chemotaxis methyl-accepting protein methylase